jgi:hypothetical protein
LAVTVTELANLVAEMRRAQKEYFRTRSSGALDKSKALEKQVDAAVKECLEEPGLFAR